MDRLQMLVFSLVVPGYYQISSGEKKFGYTLFAIYFIFWALAFIQSLPIGILAMAIWAYSLYDALAHMR
jgi:dolichol kinase